ncbi:MAG: hypothetical protein PHG67_14550 [Bacteroidales bacterium]|nr:hypothetical protein [Bacteroidales bacterium]
MKTLPWIILTALLFIVLAWRECTRPPRVVVDYQHTTDTIPGDSIPVPYPVVQIKTVDCTRIVEVPANVDTAAILAAYFSENYYTNYPIVDDSNVFVSLDAMVSENRLRWVVPYVQIRRPQVINHYTTIMQPEPGKRKIMLSGGAFAFQHPKAFDAGIMAEIAYKNWELGAGYGVGETKLLKLTYTFN